ncbi:RagB/SusD family nutrient uptake outer membrane protein [uncultured Sunxiuqinia sp.]|uniref:RagB/SusD family nutrient uptake outer membrane protein n=1 Tax=uncultured Sunxiuqinia sp. TaxID=1573825 RepID=UPI002639341B|nr:RagB/SusD family nutrient uptake outer membrane protein [uncultured Sunxiuqinia sp.]
MKGIKYTIILGIFLFVMPLFNACTNNDFLDEDVKDRILIDNLYQNHVGFEVGLNGLYATLLQEHRGSIGGGTAYPTFTMMKGGMDNVFAVLWPDDNIAVQDLKDKSNPEVFLYYHTWSWLYEVINAANTIISRAENENVDWGGGKDDAKNLSNKNIVIAEARCIRAWAYRHLTNLWGDVPLRLEESGSNNITRTTERTNVREIENQMEEDFKFAVLHLPNVPERPGKVSKAVAQHYLAELYLKWGDYAKAEQMADNVINSGDYTLVTDRYGVTQNRPGTPFSDLFLEGNVGRSQGNTEVLWSWHREFSVIGGENFSIHRRWCVWPYDRYYYDDVSGKKLKVTYERGGRGLAAMAMTKWALELYEDGDDRNSEHAMRRFFILEDSEEVNLEYNKLGDTIWIDITNTEENFTLKTMWPSARKNEWALKENPSDAYQYDDSNYLRLAETYFLRAEAEIKLGKLDEAAETINIIRRRSNASDITATEATIDFLLDERSRELVWEEHRRYVLVRNNKYVERLQAYNPLAAPNVTERDRLFPIPQVEMDLSPETMVQNPGWK